MQLYIPKNDNLNNQILLVNILYIYIFKNEVGVYHKIGTPAPLLLKKRFRLA